MLQRFSCAVFAAVVGFGLLGFYSDIISIVGGVAGLIYAGLLVLGGNR